MCEALLQRNRFLWQIEAATPAAPARAPLMPPDHLIFLGGDRTNYKEIGDNNFGEDRTTKEATPESAIAYHQRSGREKYANAGLKILEPIHYGGWSGSPGAVHGQDIIVACLGES